MTNMILILIIVVLLVAYLVWTTIYITNKYLVPKNNIREMELKNAKYELFSTISVESINEYLNLYFEEYIKRYIAVKFILKKINYIKEEDCETLVKDITKVIYIEISELYIFYIRMIYAVNSDDDLLKFINTKVRNLAVEHISSYNSSRE